MSSDLETVRDLARAALGSLEANRRRIDDLNVYPVPDGDTGTNLTLTARSVTVALDASTAADRATLARETTRAALMGARGNSGVILSQIVRGAAEQLGGGDGQIDAATAARALRGASDAAYRAVRKPVEGTMLTIVRELAEEAERRVGDGRPLGEYLADLVHHGEHALARTPEQLEVLREAGVVDAGGAGLLEIVRGIAAAVSGEPIAAAEAYEEAGVDALHQELSRYRYCTVFVVEGDALDADALEDQLDPLGDSLLVVGDASALKVHVHTDDPGAALSAGAALGVLEQIEIANMHRQTEAREERVTQALAVIQADAKTSEAVAVVAGDGNRRLFESLGAGQIVEGGQSMNPSTQQLVDAIDGASAAEVIVLPNNSNVIMTAEQAARLASKPVRVVRTDSIQAGLVAMVAYDPDLSAEANVAEMHEALAALATGEVTVASRDAELNGVAVRKGAFLGLVEGEPVAAGTSFDDVTLAVVERLLAEPRELLTLLKGEEEPELERIRRVVAERYPGVDLEVLEGGQPHYPLLLFAESGDSDHQPA